MQNITKTIFYFLLLFLSKANSQTLKYNDIFSIACHNCYDPKYSSNIVDVFNYTNTIELDIWDSKIFSGGIADFIGAHRMNQDWYVKHEPQQNGNLNCCGGTFQNCLERIKSWSDSNPTHDVYTIFIDKEENWSDQNETRKPIDLDELLLKIFTREKIFTVSDLIKDKKNLKAAVLENWPCLNSLKGKFIFVITDANAALNTTGKSLLNEYIDNRGNNSICFVAPEISNESEIENPKGISVQNNQSIVFYNLKYANRKLAEKTYTLGFVSRVFGSPETISEYNELVNCKVNFIAMFNYKLK